MPELRKRPAPKETATPAPVAKRAASKPRAVTASKAKKEVAKVEAATVDDESIGGDGAAPIVADEVSTAGNLPETIGAGTPAVATETGTLEQGAAVPDDSAVATVPLSEASIGKKIALGGFGGTVQIHSGSDVTLAELLARSEKGVVLFTYPKASTPGCTTQACLFRDSYAPLQAAGLSVFGLSTDSPKANTTFATKQKLPFDLLCDPDAGLTGALGLKKSVGKGTLRGSVVIGKEGSVESWIQAGPGKTLEGVLEWVKNGKGEV